MKRFSIIRTRPVFKETVWGGSRLKSVFGYDIPSDRTGECWAIAAHRNGDCVIEGAGHDGKTLSWLWKNEPDFFYAGVYNDGCRSGDRKSNEDFPLLVKMIDAREDLSIQVHPDEEYARIHENGAHGKTECWYILDCDKDAQIIIGHNAKSREELEYMINNGLWNDLIRRIPIKKGDFFQISPGTVHAIKGGTMILETQQNSDITYRLYDYDRLSGGKPRMLHIRQSIDVICTPFDPEPGFDRGRPLEGGQNSSLVKCGYYQVWHLICTGHEIYGLFPDRFMLCSVISGSGAIRLRYTGHESSAPEEIGKGDHFIIPAGCDTADLEGNIELICSVCYDDLSYYSRLV